MEEILKELKLLTDGEIRAKCKELDIKGIFPVLRHGNRQTQNDLGSMDRSVTELSPYEIHIDCPGAICGPLATIWSKYFGVCLVPDPIFVD